MARKALCFEHPKHVRFECNRCAICCGDTEAKTRMILLMRCEADRISQRTTKPLDTFVETIEGHAPYVYCMKKTDKGKCLFLSDSSCTIYKVRPLICRFYPFELRNVGEGNYVFACTDECPGIGQGIELDEEHFEKLFAQSKETMKRDRNGQSPTL